MKSQLITWSSGQVDGPAVLVLHDRHGDGGNGVMEPLAQGLAQSHRLHLVRSARTQSDGNTARGYYWHLGPYDQPEVSTLGDALYHLEQLMQGVYQESGRKLVLIGRGEGGGVALLMGLLWPDMVAGVVSIDGPLATNMGDLPVEWPDAAGLKVLLLEETRALSIGEEALKTRGAQVERLSLGGDAAQRIEQFVTGLAL